MIIEDRSKFSEAFDDALNRAATIAIKNSDPVKKNKNSTYVGSTIVEKNENGLYDIKFINQTMLFENLSSFDVAMIIAQRYNTNEQNIIKQVIALDEKYSKHHTAIVHYLHCFKSAKKRNDIEKMCIFEDKFQVAEGLAKLTKDRIAFFKRVKSTF